MKSCSAVRSSQVDLANHPNRRPGCLPILGRVSLQNSAGEATDQVLSGEPVTLEIQVDPRSPVTEPHFAIGFEDMLGCRLFTVATYLSDSLGGAPRRPRGLRCELDRLPLCPGRYPGRYCLTLNAGPREGVWMDVVDQALWFDVAPSDFYGNGRIPNPDWGRFLVRSRWQVIDL
jgi:hypothetical protein